MRKGPLDVTLEDYLNVLTAISSSFLKTQSNYTHTLIFRSKPFVVRYEPEDESLHVDELDETYFYKFLGEFAVFALKTTLDKIDANKLILNIGEYEFTVRLLPEDKIGIRKVIYRKK
jgi:hypothetical protein